MDVKFANRISEIEPSMTLQITAKARELKAKGYDVVSFGAGEPDFDTPDFIKSAAIKAIDEGYTKYTPSAGSLELREAICRKLKNENNVEYKAGQVIVCCGAKHALYNLFQVLLNPDDEVLLPAPYWVSYPEMVKLCGARNIIIETSQENDFKIKVSDLEKFATNRTKAVIINSPSNPTGTIYSKNELMEISDFCVKNNIWIVSDEIYEKLCYDGNVCVSSASFSQKAYENTIIINGMSKSFSMTGWRIGYAAGPKCVIEKMQLLQDHSTSNACSISQKAALAALENKSDCVEHMRRNFQRRRDIMVNELSKIKGISCFKPKGAFYVFCDISKTGMLASVFSSKLLDSKHTAVIPGEGFGCKHHIRLSFAVSEEHIIEGISRIKDFVENMEMSNV